MGCPLTGQYTCCTTAYFWTVRLSNPLVMFADISMPLLLLWMAVWDCLVNLLNCGACTTSRTTAPTHASHVRHAAWHPASAATLALVGLGHDGLHGRHMGRCQYSCLHPACIGLRARAAAYCACWAA